MMPMFALDSNLRPKLIHESAESEHSDREYENNQGTKSKNLYHSEQHLGYNASHEISNLKFERR